MGGEPARTATCAGRFTNSSRSIAATQRAMPSGSAEIPSIVDQFADAILSFPLRGEAWPLAERQFPLATQLMPLQCNGFPEVARHISVNAAEFPGPSGDFTSRADAFPCPGRKKSGPARVFSLLFAEIDRTACYITPRGAHFSAAERDLPSRRARETLAHVETTGGVRGRDARIRRRHASISLRSVRPSVLPHPLNRDTRVATTRPHASPFAPTFGETLSTSRQPPTTLGDPLATTPLSHPTHRTGP